MTDGPDRDARPWVNVIVAARHQDGSDGFLVGRHHDRGVVFPGGRVNPFERLAAAAAREFSEETGIPVSVGKQLHTFEVVDRRNDYHKVVILFAGTIENGRAPEGADDLTDCRYATLDELIDDPDVADLTLRVAVWLHRNLPVKK